MSDSFYTDEPIDWSGGGFDDEDDRDHQWDYYEPDENDEQRSWQAESPIADDDDVPEPIRRLVEAIWRQPWDVTAAKAFYEQAQMMADYADDAPLVPFMSYFPTYRNMNVAQMRSYFTLRKMLRMGKAPDVSLSYIFVYIYETLMQVGVSSPEEGYEILQELRTAYGNDGKLDRYLGPWMRDYVVYYNLSDHFAEQFGPENELDALSATMTDYANVDDKLLADTANSLSKYKIMGAALFSRQPEKATKATAYVLRDVLPVIERQCHHHVETLCLGTKQRRQIRMFDSAVFYAPHPVMRAEISVAPRHRFFCINGLWSMDAYRPLTINFGKLLGQVLHETDRLRRDVLGVKPRLGKASIDGALAEAVGKAVKEWDAKEKTEEAAKEAERHRVTIDFSKLGSIRTDAAVVQDKLLDGIDLESTTEEVPISPINPPTPINPTKTIHPINPTPRPKNTPPKELTFLHLLLTDGDWRQYLRQEHVPEGVMIENVNSMMIDKIGDIVIEDNGQGPELIEDYRPDIEQMIKENGKQQ